MTHTRKSTMLSRRTIRLTLAFMLIGAATLLLLNDNRFLTRRVEAAGFVVTNTDDSGAGSLRQAIFDANSNGSGATDTITFNIPGSGVHAIKPLSELPTVTTPTVIDGYSQPGASANTLDVGDNAVILIELDGSNAGASKNGLIVNGQCTIKGLVINRFTSNGILVQANGNTIEGNFIGTDPSGSQAAGQTFAGVYVTGTLNVIGGVVPAARNVISGNKATGVMIAGNNAKVSATSNSVKGNYIGTNAGGNAALGNKMGIRVYGSAPNNSIGGSVAGANVVSGNTFDGISVQGAFNGADGTVIQSNRIGVAADGMGSLGNGEFGVYLADVPSTIVGGLVPAGANVIAFNGKSGVSIQGSTSVRNQVVGNSIYSNGELGIDLNADGITANDAGDGDADANGLQNYPVLGSATPNGNNLTILGTLSSAPNKQYRLEFFASTACDPSGNGEGQTLFGTTDVTTSAAGTVGINVSFPMPVGQVITATATDKTLNNTSEFSACILAGGSPAISINDISVEEGNVQGLTTQATFAVTLSKPSIFPVTVKYATQAGTATSNIDYQFINSTTLTFAPGETSRNVTVMVGGDTYQESDETFFLNLSAPTNATFADNHGIATIINDDAAPSVTITDVTIAEGNNNTTNFNFTVTLSYGSAQSRSVDFLTVDDTTTTGDYQPQGSTLTFNPGQTQKTITVLVNGDTDPEPDDTFFVNLSNPVNATLAKAQGKGTITNDDAAAPAAPTVQFSQANYGVQEALGMLTLTVTRSGDTSTAASVDYATADDKAEQKNDYEIASGKLTFAPGESTRTVVILINEDMHIEGSETFKVLLSNPSGASLGQTATAFVAIVDDVPESPMTPIDDAESFVYTHYHDFLNREPDADGLAFWTNEIASCGNDAQCIEEKRINVSAAFFLSIEFQETGYLLHLLQRESFASMPKYAEFMRDLQEVSRGVIVKSPGWEQKLAANRQQFAENWVERASFKAAYDGMSNADYVNALYANAGIVPPQAERDALVTALDTANQTRAAVLLEVAANTAFRQQEQSSAFVLMQYFGYLRRDPDSGPDSDLSGYHFWLAKLNSFNGDYQQAEMVKAFLTSIEYRARFGQ